MLTEDPTPANELDILQPSWLKSSGANQNSIGSDIEKVIYVDEDYMPRVSVGRGTAWNYVGPYHGPRQDGFDDLTLFGKYAFYYSLQHEFLTAISLQRQLPTENAPVEARSHTSIGPVLLWEKALRDLPDLPILKYSRPLGFRATSAICRLSAGTPVTTCLRLRDRILPAVPEQQRAGYRAQVAASKHVFVQ